jgi:OOP family OmpA-OmpF porin
MKSRAKAALAVLGLACALAMSASAAAQESGFYVGATLGQSEFQDECTGSGGGFSCDDKDSAWRVLFGYQFNRYIAVEGGYHNFGEATASGFGVTATAEMDAFEVLAVGSFPFTNQFSGYGKLGLYRGERQVSSNIPGFGGTDTNNDFTFGFGLRFDFTRNLGLRAEWQRYVDVGDVGDVDVMSVGVIFKF